MAHITAAVVLILLHGPGGHEVRINPAEVTSLRASIPGADDKIFTEAAKCMVNLTDGKYVAVVETCADVQKMLENSK